MKFKIFLFLVCSIFFGKNLFAQPCTNLGQTPSTAFPVCGTTVFHQTNVPYCSSNSLFVPGCSGSGNANYENKNPYFYKFTCFASGTLGFTITPLAANEDYDWQLYDVTGLSPNAIFTNQNIIVSGNWSGSYGPTGTSSSGVNFIQCASDPANNAPRFAKMPNLIVGHDYILMISHYSDTPSGYDLSFSGGTAVITDPTLPHLKSVNAICDGTQVRVKLNKKMKCNSLASNGSDFYISGGGPISIVSAVAPLCNTGFDMDSVIITLSAPLPPGNYFLGVKNGTDGNTILDNCDRGIPVNEELPFTINVLMPTLMDSLAPLKCAPQSLTVFFKKPIRCNSITANGSEFVVTGPSPVVITQANTNCNNNLTTSITLSFQNPMTVGGTYTLDLVPGSDGNTIIDECGQQTPVNNSLSFSIKDTVNADFTYNLNLSCGNSTVNYHHNGAHGVNQWSWIFSDPVSNSTMQNPTINYPNIPSTNTELVVNNGFCSDTSRIKIVFDNYLKSGITGTDVVCPNDRATFTPNTIGSITSYQWDLGNGQTSLNMNPPPQTYTPNSGGDYNANVSLIVGNAYGCRDTANFPIKVVFSCFIAVPTAFTPNGDGLNDYLYPLVAYKATELEFSIFNRYGVRVFYSNDWQRKWDGTYKGYKCDTGTYVWMLKYTLSDTGQKVFQRGTSILIR